MVKKFFNFFLEQNLIEKDFLLKNFFRQKFRQQNNKITPHLSINNAIPQQDHHQGSFNNKFQLSNKSKPYDNHQQQQMVHTQQQQIWAPPQQGVPLTLVLPQQPTTSAQRFPATSSRMIVELPN